MSTCNKRAYQLVCMAIPEPIANYFISEEDYFEYYQSANDPTFECYKGFQKQPQLNSDSNDQVDDLPF